MDGVKLVIRSATQLEIARVFDVSGKVLLTPAAGSGVWCQLPYPGHPKGCPNYGKRETCPPNSKPFLEVFDYFKPMSLVVVMFDLGWHKEKMLRRHPDWSDRQAACLLYWQGGVRKTLVQAVEQVKYRDRNMISTTCPEAMGVNVIEMLKALWLPVETPVEHRVFKVALVGYPRFI